MDMKIFRFHKITSNYWLLKIDSAPKSQSVN